MKPLLFDINGDENCTDRIMQSHYRKRFVKFFRFLCVIYAPLNSCYILVSYKTFSEIVENILSTKRLTSLAQASNFRSLEFQFENPAIVYILQQRFRLEKVKILLDQISLSQYKFAQKKGISMFKTSSEFQANIRMCKVYIFQRFILDDRIIR